MKGAEQRLAARRPYRELLALAWPATLSYLLTNSFRINDQFWIQGLGEAAQSALGALFFVVVMNYAFFFLAAGGTLALVAQATGGKRELEARSVERQALYLALLLGVLLGVAGGPLTPLVVRLLGLDGEEARLAQEFLGTLYLWAPALAIVPVLDYLFIGRGDTRTPLLLHALSFALNWVLNPLFIYGRHAADRMDVWGCHEAAQLGAWLGWDGFGMAGSAAATGLARLAVNLLALVILERRDHLQLLRWPRFDLAQLRRILALSAPTSLAIAIYASVYWALFGLVLAPLGSSVRAGLGVGFQVFEGLAFPCYVGVALATASLVGRALGAGDLEAARLSIAAARRVGLGLGLTAAAAFLFVAPLVAPAFTADLDVLRETLRYVGVLAFAQVFVAIEAVNEKVLLGAGHTRPILWIASSGNALRIPLGYWIGLHLGCGATGVYWVINATSALKAALYYWQVERGDWKLGLPAPTLGAHLGEVAE